MKLEVKLERMDDPIDLQIVEERLATCRRSYDQEIRTPDQPGKVPWEIIEDGMRACIEAGLRAEKRK